MGILKNVWYIGRTLFLEDTRNISKDDRFKIIHMFFTSSNDTEKKEQAISTMFVFRFIYIGFIINILLIILSISLSKIIFLLLSLNLEVSEISSIIGLVYTTMAAFLFGLGQYKSAHLILMETTTFAGGNFYEIRNKVSSVVYSLWAAFFLMLGFIMHFLSFMV